MGTNFVIFIIITGIATLLITAPLWNKRPRTSYLLMVIIPAVSMGIFMTIFPASKDILSHNKSSPVVQTESGYDLASLQEIAEQNPDDVDKILDLAGAYIAEEQYGKAISLLKSKQAQFPDNADIPMQIANAYFAQGLLYAEKAEFDKALDSLGYAREYAPDDAAFMPDLEHFIDLIKKDKEQGGGNTEHQ